MKKQKKYYLAMYEKWCVRGSPFLCNHFGYARSSSPSPHADSLFALFMPTGQEIVEHVKEGYHALAWGLKEESRSSTFTELRQNIILLMAAMNGEL